MLKSPPAIAADSLHALAFRRGLGNTLLAAPETPVTLEHVRDFAAKSYVKQNMAIIATGADAAELEGYVSQHFADVPSGSAAQSPASKYFGGETRIPYRTPIGHFVVGFPGAAASPHVPAELTVLGNLLGGTSSIKWSAGNTILGQAASTLGASTKAIANHGTYSDTGLFSIYVMGPTNTIKNAAKASLDAIKAVAQDVKADDLKRAIAQAKFNAYAASEERTLSAESIGRSLLLSGEVPNVEQTVAELEKITASQIKSAVKKMLESKPSVTAIGETFSLPYYDEL